APLLGVGQHGVGLGGLLELLFGRFVAGISVRVVFHRELAVRALDVAVARRPRDTQNLVVVPLAHALATLTIAGRSSRPWIMYPRCNSPMTSPSRWSGLTSCTTARCRLGSKCAPSASIGRTPYRRSRSWSLV